MTSHGSAGVAHAPRRCNSARMKCTEVLSTHRGGRRQALLCAVAICCIALLCECSSVDSGTPSEVLSHGRFASVRVYRPAGAVRQVALLLSGDGGWSPDLGAIAYKLSGEGTLTAGIDLPPLFANLARDPASCVSPDTDLADLARYLTAGDNSGRALDRPAWSGRSDLHASGSAGISRRDSRGASCAFTAREPQLRPCRTLVAAVFGGREEPHRRAARAVTAGLPSHRMASHPWVTSARCQAAGRKAGTIARHSPAAALGRRRRAGCPRAPAPMPSAAHRYWWPLR